jgi:hypothetical protein
MRRRWPSRLRYADILIVIAPIQPFSPEEVQLVQRFVARGGRLLVVTDPTRTNISLDENTGSPIITPDVVAANGLLAPFDITFSDDYLYNISENEGNFRNVFLARFGTSPLTAGLSRVAFYATHSVSTSSGQVLIAGDDRTYSSQTDAGRGYGAAATSANGQVLALGDLTFMTTPYHEVADNDRLVANLADFLAGTARTRGLADFPFLFTRPVALVPIKGTTLTTGLLNQSAGLQQTLTQIGGRLTPAEAPEPGADLIAMGLFTATEELEPYVKAFQLGLPANPTTEQLTVPGVGEVSANGIGLILLSTTDERTTVVLLAQSEELLANMISRLAAGDLSTCIQREDPATNGRQSVAVCEAGEPELAGPTDTGGFEEFPPPPAGEVTPTPEAKP